MRTLTHWVMLVVLSSGCAALTGRSRNPRPEDLRAQLATLVPELAVDEIVVPHEISPHHLDAAREFMSEFVGPKSSVEDRVRTLLQMLSAPSGFGLKYEWAATRSADATIEYSGGSCLSLSAVLVGLARGLGIDAHYVDASRASSDTQKDGEITVHSGHIAVVLRYKNANAFIDFAGELPDSTGTIPIADREVVAHYYNNRGYELIHAAQQAKEHVPWARALAQFRIAAKIKPDFADAWNNVGLALARLGRDREAILAFRYALSLDENLTAAERNLAAWPNEGVLVRPDEIRRSAKDGLKWKMAAGGPAAVRWQIQSLRSELGLKPEVPKATVEPDR